MNNSPSTPKDTPGIWEFIPISEYQSPKVPVSQASRKGLSQIWSLFRQDEEETGSPFKPEEDSHLLDARQLEQISPALDWDDAATALKEMLQDWLQSDRPGQHVALLVEPPYGGHAETLRAWATRDDVTVIDPPSSAQIMDNGDAWLAALGRAASTTGSV